MANIFQTQKKNNNRDKSLANLSLIDADDWGTHNFASLFSHDRQIQNLKNLFGLYI